MYPTFRQIEYLRAVADTRSFSEAAKHCHVTQSTLSAGIKDLENILGVQLFVRTSREVYLTPEGHVLYEDSHKVFDDLNQFVQTAKTFGSDKGGVLRVGIIPTIAPYLLRPVYQALHEKYSDMHIHLHEDISSALVDGLNKKSLDIVVLAFPYPIGSYGHDIIGSDPLDLIAHKDFDIGEADKPITLQHVENLPMIMLADGHCLRDHALAACSIGTQDVKPSYQAVTMASLMEMVGAGLGVTLVPRLMIESKNFVLPDGVVRYRFASPTPARQIGIIWQSAYLKEKAMDIKNISQDMLLRLT
ncbi:MAG: hydrogen peroxide-inducible genes activator [Pseudomonadota bacterium]|nr:hypothetical protein [Alphaproteobacteria bacterium]MEC7702509.1 hydrogen peroxide-inducible genes activator [Pseudomonadota bacterium]MEC9236164.1 hydrogen peroxide-inducible genes activator [Pseudomonadota bacterium]MED5423004.1 hydrogen peroxide-inducible genes activator [Pseudomonadota bacterium]|tara:strand:+ start:2073 stop:2978 length:906 start_codon:yes stop_codon:yes gene_type:complete